MILSGSNFNNSVGAIFFEDDGGFVLHYSSEIDQVEQDSMIMASTFFQYALTRQDWMIEFLENEILPSEEKFEDIANSIPSLRVIQGGLLSGSIPSV